LRLNLAATLLKKENLSVGEVSQRVGYDSDTGFSSAFKRRYGTAPGAYRRKI
jgi:AraC-like DNA-binding protein